MHRLQQINLGSDIKIYKMKVLKVTTVNKELYVVNNPTSYMFAIEYGWEFEVVEVDDDFVLNKNTEILPQ